MQFPIAIEKGDSSYAYGVVFPDLPPGCVSAGDTLEEALANAKEAASLWLEVAKEAGRGFPQASDLKTVRENPEFAGWDFSVLKLDGVTL